MPAATASSARDGQATRSLLLLVFAAGLVLAVALTVLAMVTAHQVSPSGGPRVVPAAVDGAATPAPPVAGAPATAVPGAPATAVPGAPATAGAHS